MACSNSSSRSVVAVMSITRVVRSLRLTEALQVRLHFLRRAPGIEFAREHVVLRRLVPVEQLDRGETLTRFALQEQRLRVLRDCEGLRVPLGGVLADEASMNQ